MLKISKKLKKARRGEGGIKKMSGNFWNFFPLLLFLSVVSEGARNGAEGCGEADERKRIKRSRCP